MALWARIMVNSRGIGYVEIQRLTLAKPTEDEVAPYKVRAMVHDRAPIR